MALRIALVTGCVLAFTPVLAAEPVRIGVTTILSGQYADRGQSEQYGVELALQRINQAGGVLGRPVEAFYGDNAADPATGIAATKRLIEEQHVPVLLGALWTPVTHAIMPIVAEAKVPLVIDISAGQDFVDASGVGGNDYAFKTIPSDRDIALGLIGWLKGKGVHSCRDRQRRPSVQPRERGQHGEGRGRGRYQGSRQRDDRQVHEGPCSIAWPVQGACP